jgi:hypothetical protein
MPAEEIALKGRPLSGGLFLFKRFKGSAFRVPGFVSQVLGKIRTGTEKSKVRRPTEAAV